MLTVGNTEGFNRLTRTFKPKAIRIEQVRSGVCDVKLEFIGLTLSHRSGRWEARKLAAQLADLTGSPAFNVKIGGRLVAL